MSHAVPDGVLLLDKPAGITSMRAVTRVKRALGIKKAGHTGTLDPLATGVLAICIGQGTRVAGLLLASAKGYLAEMTLGSTTDTLDSDGVIQTETPLPDDLDEARIREVLDSFLGVQEQMPPAYSALKIKGKRAYELAREGKEVVLAPRSVEVISLDFHDVTLPTLRFSCVVSKGTYIRALIRDAGEALGCGAHMSALRRLSVGHFPIEDALSLDALEDDPEAGIRAIIPISDALDFFPILEADEEELRRLESGLVAHSLQDKPYIHDGLHRVIREDGRLLALLEPNPKPSGQPWKVHKVFM